MNNYLLTSHLIKKVRRNIDKYKLVNNLIIFLFSIILITVTIMPTVHSKNEQDGWEIKLDFSEEGGKMDQIVFGENSFSSDSIDGSDVPDPGVPPTPPYVNAYFTTPFLYPHTKLMHEFKQYSSNNPYKIWNLTLIWQGNENTNITISWNLTEYIEFEYDTILLYNDTNVILKKMLINNTYTFNCPPLIPQYFKIKCMFFYILNMDINGNGIIEVNKNGPYEYGDIVTIEAIPSSGYTFSKWSGDHIGSTNPTNITMDSNKSITANFVKEGSDGNSGSGGIPPPLNIPPVAVASVDEPYIRFIGEDVTFNGSLSYDQDGYITSWHWEFGDGAEEDGEVITHSYIEEGNYTVILTVNDNIGSTHKDTIYVDISPKSNLAPKKPTLNGPQTGNINVSYTYDIFTIDADNDHIKYVFNWGDNTKITTNYSPSGTITTQNHTWITPGRYNIWVQAIDNKNASSDKTYLTVLIDIMPINNNKIQGDLIDEDSDGIYDIFYNLSSKNKSKVSQKSDGNYLIDINCDDIWDYVFDVDKGELKDYDSKESEFNELHVYNIEVTIIATLSLISLIICLIIIKKRNKKKNKSKKH